MKILSIVPRLPPAIDGVGDYALNLARQLRKDFGLNTHFIVGDPAWAGEGQLEGFLITKLSICSAKALLSQLAQIQPSGPILLHYVGYGYAKRGCPNWLAKGLETWKHHQKTFLVTMFHEISASGPIWTSTFWLSTWQRRVAERLVEVSDHLVTSKHLYAEILQKIVSRQESHLGHPKPIIPTLPVFSNVGEPEIVLPLGDRDPTLVIFGGTASRLRVYQQSSETLTQLCHQLNIKRIVEIGPEIELERPTVPDLTIEVMGDQPAADVSRILSSALGGLIDYRTDFLAKSGIFAAYSAHGILPINTQFNGLDADGLEVQKHYWYPGLFQDDMNILKAQTIASNAYTWYQTHRLSTQASLFADYLFSH